MNDDRLSAALESLPREQAGPEFTAGVLRRIEPATPRWLPAERPARRWAPLAAAALVVLTLGFGWREWRHRQMAESLQALLAEKQALEAELESLRRLTRAARPVVYLGSDDEVDLVLDLERFRRRGGFGSQQAAAGRLAADPIRAAGRATAPPAERNPRPLRVVY